jgi:hypothetical protein
MARVPRGVLSGNYKPGDPPPSGYLKWLEWAEVQHKAGLRQVRCCQCIKFCYPQELSSRVVLQKARRGRSGPEITVKSPICRRCDASQFPEAQR